MPDLMPVSSNSPTEATALQPKPKRNKLLRTIALVFLLITVVWVLYWVFVLRYQEETQDAYVQGNVVQITPQVSGIVTQILADDTQLVQAGQTLVQLDTGDTQVALSQADAELAQAVRQVRTFYATAAQGQANMAMRQTELARAQEDLRRRQNLASSGAVAEEEVRHAGEAVTLAKSAMRVAQEQYVGSQALTQGTTVTQHPNVQAAAAHVREALLAQARTTLYAPITGQVAKRNTQVGQRVTVGAPLMAIVAPDQLWVDANFKEGQLRRIKPGQPVKLTTDLYGDKVEYSGMVVGFAAGTGSAFALLPAQNATGNWIKVVQRVPVRIALNAQQLVEHPLRIGLSVHAAVNLHPEAAVPEVQFAPTLSEYNDPLKTFDIQAQAHIDAIVAANSR